MPSALPVELDLRTEAPSAFALLHAAQAAGVGSLPDQGAWDPRAWGRLSAEQLPGLTSLGRLWAPWFEAKRCPGEEFRDSILRRWPTDSYEHEFLTAALEEARSKEGAVLVRNELKNVQRERDGATDADELEFYAILTACLQDLRKVEPSRGHSLAVHEDFLSQARWTVHNLRVFLETHWALRKTHLDIARMLEVRTTAFNDLAGCLEGTGDLATDHDDIG